MPSLPASPSVSFGHFLRDAVAMAAAVCLALPASASPSYSGSIVGSWSTAVLTGTLIDGATGIGSAQNTSATAVCNLAECPVPLAGDPASLVTWGDGPIAPPNHSVVTFVGASFSGVAPGDVFELGRLTYTNGTSVLSSLIFGATLTLQPMDGAIAIADALDIALGISTTSNTGTAAQNADFLDFGTGTFGTVLPVSFNVFEGDTATAILYGSIIGDPMTTAVFITLDPASVGHGFIGAGVPAPEPGSLLLAIGGLFGLMAARRRAAA